MAIVKYDLCSGAGKRAWYRRNWYPSEPTFVEAPGAAAEDDGVLVFVALDGARDESALLVLNATSMEEISETSTPRIGFTTHGQFYER